MFKKVSLFSLLIILSFGIILAGCDDLEAPVGIYITDVPSQ